MTTPAAKPWARARKATAGVVMTPALSTVAPPASEAGGEGGGDPVAGLAGVHAEEDAGRSCAAASECASARPMAWTVAASSGDWPATPRMPSVPKSFFMTCFSPYVLRLHRHRPTPRRGGRGWFALARSLWRSVAGCRRCCRPGRSRDRGRRGGTGLQDAAARLRLTRRLRVRSVEMRWRRWRELQTAVGGGEAEGEILAAEASLREREALIWRRAGGGWRRSRGGGAARRGAGRGG